jgi:hypothetical protein
MIEKEQFTALRKISRQPFIMSVMSELWAHIALATISNVPAGVFVYLPKYPF